MLTVVGSSGAVVLTGSFLPTAEIVPANTEVDTGVVYQGPFDANGQPIGEVNTYFECILPDGTEVWLNATDLADIPA